MKSSKNKRKRVGIICFMDGYANSNKPTEINKFLKKDHDVIFINTINIFKLKVENGVLTVADNPQVDLSRTILFVLEKIKKLGLGKGITKPLYSYLLLLEFKLRAKIVARIINQLRLDLIIGESPVDSLCFLEPLTGKTLYDCATPLADELYFGNKITQKYYHQLLDLEKEVYKKVDYLSFHWEVYNWYVQKYHYSGKNMIVLSGGCNLPDQSAKFNASPKIVYFGYLGGYWINLPLLSRLSQMYPNIDVYGSPAPDPKYNLNYKGYAKPDVLAKYQFGLITLSDDKLRREGFSAKHLEYLSYGLPVLIPKWRESANYFKGTLPYDEQDFLDIVDQASQKKSWQKLNEVALKQAKKFRWSEVLKPLNKILNEI